MIDNSENNMPYEEDRQKDGLQERFGSLFARSIFDEQPDDVARLPDPVESSSLENGRQYETVTSLNLNAKEDPQESGLRERFGSLFTGTLFDSQKVVDETIPLEPTKSSSLENGRQDERSKPLSGYSRKIQQTDSYLDYSKEFLEGTILGENIEYATTAFKSSQPNLEPVPPKGINAVVVAVKKQSSSNPSKQSGEERIKGGQLGDKLQKLAQEMQGAEQTSERSKNSPLNEWTKSRINDGIKGFNAAKGILQSLKKSFASPEAGKWLRNQSPTFQENATSNNRRTKTGEEKEATISSLEKQEQSVREKVCNIIQENPFSDDKIHVRRGQYSVERGSGENSNEYTLNKHIESSFKKDGQPYKSTAKYPLRTYRLDAGTLVSVPSKEKSFLGRHEASNLAKAFKQKSKKQLEL